MLSEHLGKPVRKCATEKDIKSCSQNVQEAFRRLSSDDFCIYGKAISASVPDKDSLAAPSGANEFRKDRSMGRRLK